MTMTSHEDAIERMKRLHPKVWRPQYWVSEVIWLGVALGGMMSFVYFCALAIVGAPGVQAIMVRLLAGAFG